MTVAFTPVGSGEAYDPFSLSIANEIFNAYSERRQAIGDSAVVDRVEGDDGHSGDFWSGLQEWIEANCTKFVNHTLATGGAFDGEAEIPMFTLETFRAVAGLNGEGFRRASVWVPDEEDPDWSVDPEFSYGIITDSDIAGPWVTEDLQKALSALKWHTYLSTAGEYAGMISTYGYPTVCSLATLNQGIWWPGSFSATSQKVYQSSAYLRTNPTYGEWVCAGFRTRHRAALTVATFRPVAVGIYYFLVAPTSSYLTNAWLPGVSTYQDVDGYGAEGTLKFWEEYPEDPAKPATRGGASEAAWIGNFTTNPVSDASIACPVNEWLGAKADGFYPVLKWNFTYSD